MTETRTDRSRTARLVLATDHGTGEILAHLPARLVRPRLLDPTRPTPKETDMTCENCGVDAPDDEACGDPCCSGCTHPGKR